MSDSEDEFGGLGTTTPLAAPGKRKARSEKPPSRALDGAGPSNNKPPSNATVGSVTRKRARTASGSKNGKQPTTADEDEDIQEIVVENGGEDEVDGPPPKQRGGSRKPVSKDSAAPARAVSSKARGKQKATTAATHGGRKGNAKDLESLEVVNMDEDEDDLEDIMEVESAAVDLSAAYSAAGSRATSKRKGPASNTTSNSYQQNVPPSKNANKSGPDAKLAAENARLKEETERLKGHIDDLKAKFEELIHTRNTEPEALVDEIAHAHEAQINVQNELIKDLHAQLAKKEPLLRAVTASGKKPPFILISRDEADEELREYKSQIHNLKNELNGMKKTMAEKDEEIVLWKQKEGDLRYELTEEVKRSDQLAKQARNPPGSASRGNPILKGDDPKYTKVIALYEDLTNILVPTVKCSAGQHEGEEWVFTCIYTWKDDIDSKAPDQSLNFSLRMCKEPSAEFPGKLVDSVHYHPLSLEMESSEFVENLGFLNKPFSFPQPQLSLFVRTLYDNLNSHDDED